LRTLIDAAAIEQIGTNTFELAVKQLYPAIKSGSLLSLAIRRSFAMNARNPGRLLPDKLAGSAVQIESRCSSSRVEAVVRVELRIIRGAS
jgi:hypothetical protein